MFRFSFCLFAFFFVFCIVSFLILLPFSPLIYFFLCCLYQLVFLIQIMFYLNLSLYLPILTNLFYFSSSFCLSFFLKTNLSQLSVLFPFSLSNLIVLFICGCYQTFLFNFFSHQPFLATFITLFLISFFSMTLCISIYLSFFFSFTKTFHFKLFSVSFLFSQ